MRKDYSSEDWRTVLHDADRLRGTLLDELMGAKIQERMKEANTKARSLKTPLDELRYYQGVEEGLRYVNMVIADVRDLAKRALERKQRRDSDE